MGVKFRPGEVITYPSLWAWQPQCGETEGRKPRPVCVIIAIGSSAGDKHLALLAITTQPPQADRIGDLKQSWIVIDEYNYDIVERSWYIGSDQDVLGRFSKSFLMKIAAAFAQARGPSGRVSRID
ncbi:hypothetical protein [Rhizobium paranaense]|uniref:Type II toxin-antitoxin system PemK/MazF family toxin n=1 Tax=Rhizobium paranaense TaxID=1650438 RepID=A0A7W9D4A1_9HYPH|nr:hypothetical protein [Rhizobium paranaense]MBB5577143.1 hypothetical protein [Rhizobium paranaense]